MPATTIPNATVDNPAGLGDSSLLRHQAFIGGAWCDADTQAVFAVDNPANGKPLADVPDMGIAETRRAIEAANAAWPAWRAMTGKQRAVLLRRWFELIMANQEDLARLITAEQGKPLTESRSEIAYGASFVEWFAEEAKRVYGDIIPSPDASKRILVIKQPIGVVAAITPWNFPMAMITRKCAPALAVGCPVIVKPAEQTPLSALALATLAEKAGIPAGVFNVVTGFDAPAIGGELTSNPLVRKLTFTGSTAVGKILMAQCAATIKKVSLELGGNAPFIVFDDADLDAAVEGAIISKFRNAGQTCVCANRFLVQNGIYDAFAEKLTARVRAFNVADGFADGAQIGPLIDKEAVAKVEAHIADAVHHGAKPAIGGHRHARGGHFFEPTVLTECTPTMCISHEETFGPVAPLFRFHDEVEAVRLANDTTFGLAAYFYGRDITRIVRVAEALEYGVIGVNTGLISTEVAPFGGVKESGIGREGSRYGVDDFLELKYISLGGMANPL